MGDGYDDVVDDLDAYMAGLDDEPLADEPPAIPDDVDGANRLLRRLTRFGRQAAQINEVADAELARIEAFRADRLSGLERQSEWHARSLEGWMREVYRRSGRKTKTVKLPNGSVSLRAGRVKVDVVDNDAAVELAGVFDRNCWTPLDANWVRTTEAIAKTNVLPYLFAGPVVATSDAGTHHQALIVAGWDQRTLMLGLLLPVPVELPGVHLIVPTQPTFGYKTTEES